jgi:hypothetical protein
MEVTIKGAKKKAATEKATVSLPLYRKHDCGGDTFDSMIYMRVDQVGEVLREVSITERQHFGSNEYTVELSIVKPYGFDSRSEIEYNAGTGPYACSEAEWLKAVDLFRIFIESADLPAAPVRD